jgi:hypothetical protein
MKIEWYVLGVPKDMAQHIFHARVGTLNEAIEAAQLFENTKSISESLGQTRTCTATQKTSSHYCAKSDFDTPSSTKSLDSNISLSKSDAICTKRVARATQTAEVEVKPETEKMSCLKTESANMQVKLAELWKPSRTTPTKQNNIWCGRCMEEEHFIQKCPAPHHKQVRMLDAGDQLPLFIQASNDKDNGVYIMYQVFHTGCGTGKHQTPKKTTKILNLFPWKS